MLYKSIQICTICVRLFTKDEWDWMGMYSIVQYIFRPPRGPHCEQWDLKQWMDAMSSSTALHKPYVTQVKFIWNELCIPDTFRLVVLCILLFHVISPLALDGLFLSCLPERSLESAANVRAAKNQLVHLSWGWDVMGCATTSKSVWLQTGCCPSLHHVSGRPHFLITWFILAHVAHVAHVSTASS